MKKVTILFSALFLITTASFSQFRLGIKGGANLGKVDGKTFNDGYNLGYQLGGFSEIDFGKIGIQPEVLFSQTNTKYTTSMGDILKLQLGDNVKLNYMNIPLLLRVNTSKFVTLLVGPQFSVLMNPHETTLQNGKDAFKKGDFAMVGGLQFNLKLLRIYGRYNIGLNDISDISNSEKWNNQQIQLGVGLKLL